MAGLMIAGCDFSTHAIDIVLLDEDTDAAKWHRFDLHGQDAFDRTRAVRAALPFYTSEFWDDILAVGIEQPRGNHGVVHMARIQGAILACIPHRLLVNPLNPSEWRKTVGLPGNAPKDVVAYFALNHGREYQFRDWPQDACDAYCIALATRTLLEHKDAA